MRCLRPVQVLACGPWLKAGDYGAMSQVMEEFENFFTSN